MPALFLVAQFECRVEVCDRCLHCPLCSLSHSLSAELNHVTDTCTAPCHTVWVPNCLTDALIVPCGTASLRSQIVWLMLDWALWHDLSAELCDRCPHCSVSHSLSAELTCVTDGCIAPCRTAWLQSWIVWQMIALLLVAWLECWVELCDRWLHCSLLHGLSAELNCVTDDCIAPCRMAWVLSWIVWQMIALLLVAWLECWVELCDRWLHCSLSHGLSAELNCVTDDCIASCRMAWVLSWIVWPALFLVAQPRLPPGSAGEPGERVHTTDGLHGWLLPAQDGPQPASDQVSLASEPVTEPNQHSRELISSQKTSHQHNNKDLNTEFMYLVFTCTPGESYRRRHSALLLWLCDVFWALINSL